jgi:transcriptional regulator with XRE-family HTH domain
MSNGTSMGEFLRARRAQRQPVEVGLPDFDGPRRVPGLRRDELARLAGVSESYYIRLEQGLSRNASPQVLDAIATALRLDDNERGHLHDLAAAVPARRRIRRPAPEYLTATTRQLIAAFGDTPVIVLGRRSDVLGWNATGHALFAGHLDPDAPNHPGHRPNTARLVFTDPHTRDLYPDWPKKARDVVGRLRVAVGRHPDDPLLAALIGELATRSDEFSVLWAEHRVRAWDIATYRMRHPLVGALEVVQQAIAVPDAADHRLVAVTAEPDSPTLAALTLLAHATA